MKALNVIASVAAIAAVAFSGWWLASPDQRDPADLIDPSHPPPRRPNSANITPAEVFQRAFWKRPTEDDKILHAERYEWADSNGVQKWQWFIVVEPSTELTKYLRTDNAFNLIPTSKPSPSSDNAPAWFKPNAEPVEHLTSPQSNLCLSFSQANGRLYATDTGNGFQPGRAETVTTPVIAPSVTSRLPTTPPPRPKE